MDPEEHEIVAAKDKVEEIEEIPGDPHTGGRWEGSNVTPAEVAWMYKSRRIPAGVECRLPAVEIEPKPDPSEVVVFTAHFVRGFGLPDSCRDS
jgi:hypothetical protein